MASRTIDKQIGNFRDDLDRLSQDVRAMARVLTDTGAEQAANVKDRVFAATDQARREVERLSGEAQAHGRAKLKELEETVEAKPLTSLLVAFVAGIVLGKILNR